MLASTNTFPGHLLKLAPVITWPLLVGPKSKKKQLGHRNTWAQKHTYGQSVFEVGSGTMPKFARSLFACSEFVPGSPGVRSEFVRSSFRVRSEFVRSLSGVGSEFVRSSFGVRSEFVRSSFGACSELVHREPGASEKRLLRKNTFCSALCSVWPKLKNVPMQDLLQITTFFVKTRDCRKRKPNLSKYEQKLGSNITYFARTEEAVS